MVDIVRMIQQARDRGQDVTADMYPYLAGATALASSLPPWVADGGMNNCWSAFMIRRCATDQNGDVSDGRAHLGESLSRCRRSAGRDGCVGGESGAEAIYRQNSRGIAQAQKKDPLDALMDFVLADKGLSGALYFIASEEDLQTGLRQPWTSIGLDANELSLDGPLFEPHTHPRSFGSMPRFLGHYVRDLQLMPLEQAIRKITSLPAQREHLTGRGLIKEGFFADITIFDPDNIIDKATYTQPAQLAEGVKYVIVNGQVAFENGKATGAMAGKPLKGQGVK